MTQKTQPKRRKKIKLTVSSVILLIGLVVFLVPTCIFGWFLYQSSAKTGDALFGNRFSNDLNPAITSTQISGLKDALKATANVENVEISLKAATLRVSIDAPDALVATDLSALSLTVANVVKATLPIETYFTATDVKKMYDLEINVYNLKDGKDKPGYVYFILVKNANMATWTVQEVSKAVNQALADELRAEMAAGTLTSFMPTQTMKVSVEG